ncbi:MAG: CRISPR-associated protein Cas4 [Methanomassiliicoccales archaeon]|nr:CRISPR-associated protein Cas4 [Methanomassiliicoccales archaeon]
MVAELMIQVSDITQYFYCPRKIYFLRVLGVSVPSKPKMEMAKEEHEKEHQRVVERKEIYGFPREEVKEVLHSVAIEASEYHLYGVIDTVLILTSGEIIPVDIKYSRFEEKKRNWTKQLVAYSLLLESKMKVKVTRAALFFPESKKRIIIEISSEDKKALLKDIDTIMSIIINEVLPNVSKDKKCSYCEMNRFCTL